MSLFASNVRYFVGTTAGERLPASGFQVGVFAVAPDWKHVQTARGTKPGSGFYVDHWPTGLTLAWFESFDDALWFADELSTACGFYSVDINGADIVDAPIVESDICSIMEVLAGWADTCMSAPTAMRERESIVHRMLADGDGEV